MNPEEGMPDCQEDKVGVGRNYILSKGKNAIC